MDGACKDNVFSPDLGSALKDIFVDGDVLVEDILRVARPKARMVSEVDNSVTPREHSLYLVVFAKIRSDEVCR